MKGWLGWLNAVALLPAFRTHQSSAPWLAHCWNVRSDGEPWLGYPAPRNSTIIIISERMAELKLVTASLLR